MCVTYIAGRVTVDSGGDGPALSGAVLAAGFEGEPADADLTVLTRDAANTRHRRYQHHGWNDNDDGEDDGDEDVLISFLKIQKKMILK